MLHYPEVYTDFKFISISTIPFDHKCLEKNDTKNEIEDGFHCNSISIKKYTFRNEENNLSMTS